MPYQRGQLATSPAATVDLDPWLGTPGLEPTYSGGGVNSGMGTLVVGTNRWLDFGLVVCPNRIKTLFVVITAALTSAGAQQATIQLFVARSIFSAAGTPPGPGVAGVQAGSGGGAGTPFTPVASAVGSQFPTNPSTNLNAGQLRGTPTNLGTSVASLGPAVFAFSPADIPDLQWEWPVVGAEITAPAAFTGGTVTVYLELANV